MNKRINSILFYLPKAIVFGLALLNFFYILSHISFDTGTGVSFPIYSAWYETPDFYIVLFILAATVFLLINDGWSYLIATAISGFFSAIGLIQIFFRNMGLLERWEGIQKYELNVLLAIEIQWLLAGVVFTLSTFYLIQHILSKNNSKYRFS
jgi:hypothetical protein